jgi:Ca2+-binding RTX toxin-like protein
MTSEQAPTPTDIEPLGSRGEPISVSPLQPGEVRTIIAEAGASYVLEFDPALAEALIEDGALVLRFPDGGRIVFENLEDLVIESEAPRLYADGQDVLSLLVGRGVLPGTVIEQPQPGESVAYDLAPGQRVVLDFDPAAARVLVEGDVFVLRFADGGQIRFPGLGVLEPGGGSGGLTETPPVFVIADLAIEAPTLVAIAAGWPRTDLTRAVETAAGEEEPQSGGITAEDPPIIPLEGLTAQGVIGATELLFTAPDPGEPLDEAPETGLPVGSLSVAGKGFFAEDQETAVTLAAKTGEPFDVLSEITLAGLVGWTINPADLAAAETEPGVTDASFVDGVLTIEFGGEVESFRQIFRLTPPQSTDADVAPVLTIVARDGGDPSITNEVAREGTFIVDAVADGGVNVTSTGIATSQGGEVVDLNLTLAAFPGNPSNPDGDLQNPGGFDDDGSESVTKVTVVVSGDDGAVLRSSDPALFDDLLIKSKGQTWIFEGEQADLQSLVSSLQLDPSGAVGGEVRVDLAVTTSEANTPPGAVDASGQEPATGNNTLVENFGFAVTVEQDPVLVVGSNAGDDPREDEPHRVANPFAEPRGEILGNASGDVLIGDSGGSGLINKTANIALILDTSGSMSAKISFGDDAASRIEALKASVINLLREIAGTEGATVSVRIVAFEQALDTLDLPGDGLGEIPAEATFDITGGELADAEAFVNALQANGATSYEAGFEAIRRWWKNEGIAEDEQRLDDADVNQTIFISDGLPNRALVDDAIADLTDESNAQKADAQAAIDEVQGEDEAAPIIDQLGEIREESEVRAVGINVDGDALLILDQLDDGGDTENVTTGEQLVEVLGDIAALTDLQDIGGDTISGGEGDDLIFGDSIFTDLLAEAEGVDLPDGSGWAVIEELAARDDFPVGSEEFSDPIVGGDQVLIDFLRDNLELYDLGRESVIEEELRSGGDDIIDGGAGNDVIFGQEGDDEIRGGSGDDTLSGGSGADTFVYIASTFEGADAITDFSATSEGDRLRFEDVVDGGTPGLDENDVIASFVDGGGAGADDTITLVGGTVITVTDLDDALKSAADVFANAIINGA